MKWIVTGSPVARQAMTTVLDSRGDRSETEPKGHAPEAATHMAIGTASNPPDWSRAGSFTGASPGQLAGSTTLGGSSVVETVFAGDAVLER